MAFWPKRGRKRAAEVGGTLASSPATETNGEAAFGMALRARDVAGGDAGAPVVSLSRAFRGGNRWE